jgi:hypothetical protein
VNPLGAPVQIAYGVTEVHDAAARFRKSFGAGPFVFAEHIALASSTIRGEPAPFDHSSAYGQWGPLMVELVAEHTPPLVAPGSGVHHVAFMVERLGDAIDWCGSQGWPELLHAVTVGRDGQDGQEFAFVDARHEVGHLVELYERSERLVGFYAHVARLAADDGSGVSTP